MMTGPSSRSEQETEPESSVKEDIPEMEIDLPTFFEDYNECTDDPQQFTTENLDIGGNWISVSWFH